MPIRLDSQEADWQQKIAGAGIQSLEEDYLPAGAAWDSLLTPKDESSGIVLQFPKDLGYNPKLENYILFHIYDTGGDALEQQRSSFVTSSETATRFKNLTGSDPDNEKSVSEDRKKELDELKENSADLFAGAGLGFLSGGLLGAVGGVAGVAWLESGGATNLLSAFEAGNKADTSKAIQGKGIRSFASTRLGFADKTSRSNVSIALPMTAQLNSSHSMDYEDTDLTGVLNLMSATKAGKALMNESPDADTDEMKVLLRKVGALPTAITEGISKILGSSTEINLTQFQDAANRQTPNKFKEQIFKGVGRRSFTFSWELIPSSKEDVLKIYSIVYAFKKFSHPKLANSGLFLDYPGQFKIGFFNGIKQNDFLFRIGLCACTKVEVTYGGKDLIFFRDFEATLPPFSGAASAKGAPANSIKLQLEFTELELLTRERIQQGY